MDKLRVLITGGAGFIGSHFVEVFLEKTDWELIIFDKLTYASSGYDRLREIDCMDNKRVQVFSVDFTEPISEGIKKEVGRVDIIIHMGAETHVDNSIKEPLLFERVNVLGTVNMLEYARGLNLKRFFYFSTDEVFGPAPEGTFFKEQDQHNPNNPYAASKSGAEAFVKAYGNTYGIPYIITRTMNVFGERQHAEKFIPMVVNKVLSAEEIFIHADKSKTKPGSRCWIYAKDVAMGYLNLIYQNPIFTEYHLVGEELSNLDLAYKIAEILEKPLTYSLVDFHSQRPGHDLRYAMDGGRMKAEFQWEPNKETINKLKMVVMEYYFINNPRYMDK